MLKKIIVSILSVFLFTIPIQADSSYFTTGREHSTLSYDELAIRHVEEDEFEQLLKIYDEKYEQQVSFESIKETFDALNHLQSEASLIAGLLYIKVVQDTNDTQVSEELTYTESLVEKYANEINIRGKALVQSQYRQQIQATMEPLEFEFYETYEEISELTLQLSEQESRLLNEYYVLLNDVEKNSSEIADIYLKLMDTRRQIAKSVGYHDPIQYYYEKVFEREYTADDLNQYRLEIKESVTPVFFQLLQDLVLLREYPIDTFDEKENFKLLEQLLNQMDSSMVQGLDYLRKYGYYDLNASEKKMDAGFTTMLSNVNEAFIFNKAEGDFSDLTTLIHEFGHYNHYYFMTEEDLYYANDALDLAEIHSQGLEVLFSSMYDQVFDDSQNFMRTYLLLNLTHSVITGSLFDEFQVEAFKQQCTTEEELDALYLRLLNEYHLIDENGENMIGFDWRDIHHTFESPFYYISYANSAIPSLELYAVMNQDIEKAKDMYLSLASDYDIGFVEALEKHGFSNPFEKGSVTQMMETIQHQQESIEIDDEGNLLVNLVRFIIIGAIVLGIIKIVKRH